MGFLDHGDIITTITDTRNSLTGKLSKELCDDCLLCWTTPANAYRLRVLGSLKELVLQIVIFYDATKCLAVNHQHCGGNFRAKFVYCLTNLSLGTHFFEFEDLLLT
jgi:hypothetical protein